MQIKRKVTHIKPYLLSILNLKNNFHSPALLRWYLLAEIFWGLWDGRRSRRLMDSTEKDHWLLVTVHTSLLHQCQLTPLQQTEITFPVSFGSYYAFSTDSVVWFRISLDPAWCRGWLNVLPIAEVCFL